MPDRDLPPGSPRRDRAGLMAAPLAAALVLLSGCGGNGGNDGKAAASGEVMPGSVSDAMLPLDTVRSQPPLAPPSGSTDRHAAAASDSPEAAASQATEPRPDAGSETPEKPAATATGSSSAN